MDSESNRASRDLPCPNWLARWIAFSVSRPRLVLASAALVFALSVFFASKLELKTDLVELLPTDAPSVVNLETMRTRVAVHQNLAVAIECPDLKAAQKFSDDITTLIRALPPEEVLAVDNNIKEIKDYYTRNKYLFADLEDLVEVRDKIAQRIQEETEGALVESLDDEPAPRTDLKFDRLREKYESKVKIQERYVDGYYTNPDRNLVAVFIYPPSSSLDTASNQKLVDKVQGFIRSLNPAAYHPEMKVGLTGEIKTGLEEREALKSDMTFVSLLCLGLIALLIVVYYRSIRITAVIGVPMLLGLAAALAVTTFAIGYLNTATAFLAAIIAGNGINFMLMLTARFFEEARCNPDSTVSQDLTTSAWSTLRGTLIAGLGASIAYGSLVFAGFRGFRQFGIIGGIGMILCWLATFLVGPALIAIMHRRKPMQDRQGRPSRFAPGRFFAMLVERWPRFILAFALLSTAASILVILPWSFDPFEYDFRKLRNVAGYAGGSAALSKKVDKIFDLPQSPTPVVTDRASDVPGMKEAILASPSSRAIIGGVKTLQDSVPDRQGEKLEVLGEIRRMIDSKMDFLSPADREKVMEYRPADDLRVIGLDDVPASLARPFQESDGSRGRILYVYGRKGDSLLDGKYLLKFARFIRGVKYDEGVKAIPVGQPMVFADMIDSILSDGLKVTAASFIGVLLLLIFAFRKRLPVFAVMLPVVIGTVWMLGVAALMGAKLNFLNFVVIPITLGISVDYGSNIISRYLQEGRGSMGRVVSSAGGAVMLCALTTIIGYATLLTSTNLALRSFGLLADVGEVACILAAEVVMTAFIVWHERSTTKIRQR